jgi:hypothetical protein
LASTLVTARCPSKQLSDNIIISLSEGESWNSGNVCCHRLRIFSSSSSSYKGKEIKIVILIGGFYGFIIWSFTIARRTETKDIRKYGVG